MEEATKITKHASVLLDEALDMLALASGKIAVDATLGGGGHTRAMLKKVGAAGKVIALDTDSTAIARAEADEEFRTAIAQGNLILAQGNYSELSRILQERGLEKVDAILADLGFSSDQIEEAGRGFSFQRSGPLDMRLDQQQGENAKDLLRRIDERELVRILCEYGEEEEASRIARAIVEEREKSPLETTADLAGLIERVYPKKRWAKLGIHPATKTFQALRIAVNRELEHLETFLPSALECLEKDGRLAIITFHSGEDRIVKHFLKDAAHGCTCPKNFPVCICKGMPQARILTKKPVLPEAEERERNPRARSAKLRGAQKI